LKPYSENIIWEYQAGFRKGESTIDQLYTVRQLLNKCWEFNVDVYQVFVDFEQAYDSIERNELFGIMNCFGIPTKLVKLVSATMEGAKSCVKIQNDLTDHFEVKRGLKQGDGLAPVLFNIVLEYDIRQLSVDVNASLIYQAGQIVGYVDDINVMGRSIQTVEKIYRELE
jgi:hypothetical protein